MTDREKLEDMLSRAYNIGVIHGEQKREIYQSIDGFFAKQMAGKLKDEQMNVVSRKEMQDTVDTINKLTKDNEELNATIDKLSEGNGSLMAELAEANKKIEELRKSNGSLMDDLSIDNKKLEVMDKLIGEKNQEIDRLQDELEAANLQVASLEKRLAETEAALLRAKTDGKTPYGLTPVKKESKGEGVSNIQHSKEVFVKYEEFDKEVGTNVECAKKFESISAACRFISERLDGAVGAESIKSMYTKNRQSGKEEIFRGYRLERCGE